MAKTRRNKGGSGRARTRARTRARITSALNSAVDNIVEHIEHSQDMDTSVEPTENVYNYRAGFDDVNYPILNVNYEYKEYNIARYAELFSNLHKLHNRVEATDKNWQFVCIVIQSNGENYEYVAYKPYYTNLSETGSRYLYNYEYNNELSELINYHISNVIYNANLGGYIREYLDKGEAVNISLDYYVGRTLGNAGWHTDTRRENSLYTNLTYNNQADILGPEIAYYDNQCMPFLNRTVFRPRINYPYGSAGFNDNIIIHSTPYTSEAESQNMLFNTYQSARILPNLKTIESIRRYANENNISIRKAAKAKDIILNDLYKNPIITQYANEHNMTEEDAARTISANTGIEYEDLIGSSIGPVTTEMHKLPILSSSKARREYTADSNLTRPSFIRCHITHHESLIEIEEIFGEPQRQNSNSYINEHKYFDIQNLDNIISEAIFKDGADNNINADIKWPLSKKIKPSGIKINDIIKRACEIKPNAGG
jgi:hypothetical protein